MDASLFVCFLFLCFSQFGFGQTLTTFYMDEICGPFFPFSGMITLGATAMGRNSSGILKATRFGSYPDDWSCSVTLRAPLGYGVVVSIQKIDFRRKCIDNITFISGISRHMYCRALFDLDEKISFVGSNDVEVLFKTGRGFTKFLSEFVLSFTAYRKGICTDGYEYTCNNGNCISSILTCDKHNHCGDRSDQKHCLNKPVGSIVGSFFGCFFLVIACVCGAIYWRNKKNRKVTAIYQQPSPQMNYSTVPQAHYPPQPQMPYSIGSPGYYPPQPHVPVHHPVAPQEPYPRQLQSQVNYATAPQDYYPPQQQYASNPTYGVVGNPFCK